MSYDSRVDTYQHIDLVRRYLKRVAFRLINRAEHHDASKLKEPELSVFDEFTPKLRDSTYGSDEYKRFLKGMGEGLQHHYAVNDHHPEHYPEIPPHKVDVDVKTGYHPSGDDYTYAIARCGQCGWQAKGDEGDIRDAAASHERENYQPSGIHAMGLLQLTEMLCDWMAATQRHADGDICRSIEQNAERFGYGQEIETLLLNSLHDLGVPTSEEGGRGDA